jgi:uncharacterized protein (TIGR03086 family)
VHRDPRTRRVRSSSEWFPFACDRGTLYLVVRYWDGLIDRFATASDGFAHRLRAVGSDGWTRPTPCSAWNVHQLVNHVTQANRNYVRLLSGGTAAEFLTMRDFDALGSDPLGAYTASVQACADAFAEPGAFQHMLDHPLGRLLGRQALAVRTTDTTIHTWDLARAVGADETLNADLVAWIDEHLLEIYAGMAEMPTSEVTTHRFFAAPVGVLPDEASVQDRLLHRMGRVPAGPS